VADHEVLYAERPHESVISDSRELSPNSTAASWLVLAVPLVIALIGAWNYRWVQEDAFINFRVITNLLAGHGPVYNVGERVEVYSDPLWLFLQAGLHEVLPFISLEWLSVILGLCFTAGGVILGGRAIQRLGGSRGEGLVLPIGLLIFSVVAGVWEFSTSGLEMGMVFWWIGLSFWLLVRTEHRRDSVLWCAFIVGLGTIIRPELAMMSVVFLMVLGLVVSTPGWHGPTTLWRRYVLPLIVALALPVLYELWRMAYFAMVVANTALAKSGGSSWWSQGFEYLYNFIAPYALWVPLLLVLPLTIPRISRWWDARDRIGVVVVLTPAVAGLADALYVVYVGGDYMHARLLLPAFLGLCLALYITVDQLRSLLVVAVAGIIAWALISAGWLRADTRVTASGAFVFQRGIANERTVWITLTGNAHPITTTDWGKVNITGVGFRQAAAIATKQGRQVLLLVPNPTNPYVPRQTRDAKSSLPFHLVVDWDLIGATGYASGPQVYVFDTLSLANPIGSHTTISVRGRPGHEKVIGPAWMIARFGIPGQRLSAGTASPVSFAAARNALGCEPLRSYLHAITAPLTLSQAVSNIAHSLTYTTMSFSPNPITAERQICR
jgi:arabinofuranosyltransferase